MFWSYQSWSLNVQYADEHVNATTFKKVEMILILVFNVFESLLLFFYNPDRPDGNPPYFQPAIYTLNVKDQYGFW